ncbi:MAG: aminoglycoside phosphotransferase family protein [Microbacterium gubbeenense]|uniref:aminoglycoside phosphotransferase family protein n=2 Tax=Microbacterium gubbeenense TaxID=159896 RepID=UPI003F95A721
MIRFDDALPDLGIFAGADALSQALGRRVRIERIRYKPGTSIVAAVRDESGRPSWVLTHADPAKATNHERAALRAGAEPVRLGSATVTGPAWADRALVAGLSDVADADRRTDVPLRYNPLRRMVMATDSRVIKVSEGTQSVTAAQHLADHGVSVIVPSLVSPRATSAAWWGAGDLSEKPSAALARRAGQELAAMHRAPIGELRTPRTSPARVAERAARAIHALVPELGDLAARLAETAGTMAGGREVVVHGDFSPDQVLVGDGEVRLIDLDRVAIGAPEQDLGSFLAAGGDEELLGGYIDAGGVVDPEALRAWRAISHLQKAVEPFRSGRPNWTAAVVAAVDDALEAIA